MGWPYFCKIGTFVCLFEMPTFCEYSTPANALSLYLSIFLHTDDDQIKHIHTHTQKKLVRMLRLRTKGHKKSTQEKNSRLLGYDRNSVLGCPIDLRVSIHGSALKSFNLQHVSFRVMIAKKQKNQESDRYRVFSWHFYSSI
jgi:hypothetical protein